VLLKAEAIVPTRELPAYFGAAQAPECHLAYHSTLMTAGWAALAEGDAGLVRAVAAATPPLPPGASWLTYVRCHDDIGWKHLQAEAGSIERVAAVAHFYNDGASYAAGTGFQGGLATNGTAAALCGYDGSDDALRRLLLVHGLALCFGGLPVLYMGDELAMANDDSYVSDPAKAHDSRWIQRAPFDEARYAQRDDAATPAGRAYAGLRRLIQLRRQTPDLAAGVPCTVLPVGDPALLALARGERFLGLFNFSGRTLTVDLAAYGRAGTVTLAPWDQAWL
jgi:amylosucrase